MIPKKIHYCWFGGNPKPEIVERCMESWRKFCPDWEIVEWNEENYDVRSVAFMSEAYDAKKWAFVSDVARLDIIYRHGGVYMDTDVELFAPLDPLTTYDAFFAFESERSINSGVGFGAVKNHPAVQRMLDIYSDKHFPKDGKLRTVLCPQFNTAALTAMYPTLRLDGKSQEIEGVRMMTCGEYQSLVKHHGTASWGDGPKLKITGRPYKNTWLKRFIKQPEKFVFVEKHFGKRGLAIYTFLVYDLPEMGVLYFLKRLVWKITRKK